MERPIRKASSSNDSPTNNSESARVFYGIQAKLKLHKRGTHESREARRREALRLEHLEYLKLISNERCDTSQEHPFVLINYRNGNKRILYQMLTHQQTRERNKFLAGTGKAWAKIDPSKFPKHALR